MKNFVKVAFRGKNKSFKLMDVHLQKSATMKTPGGQLSKNI